VPDELQASHTGGGSDIDRTGPLIVRHDRAHQRSVADAWTDESSRPAGAAWHFVASRFGDLARANETLASMRRTHRHVGIAMVAKR
jgi:hypothetical protein